MHLQAVLILIHVLRHGPDAPFFPDLLDCVLVDGETAERCIVDGAVGCFGSAEVVVVRWAEEEDSFAVCWSTDVE